MQRLRLILSGIVASQLLAAPLRAADIDARLTAIGPTVELTWDLCLSGDYAYLVSPWDGLRIVDLSAPLSPKALGLCLATSAKGVAVAPPHAYLLDSLWGLRIVDVSDPNQPKQVGSFSEVGPAERMAVKSGYLYVPTAEGKLEVLDLSDPVKPKKAGECTTGGKGRDLIIAGTYAYVACGLEGLKIVDVTVPSSPKVIGTCPMDWEAYHVAVSGNYAFVSANQPDFDLLVYFPGSIRVVDISDPTKPFEVASYLTYGHARATIVSGTRLYVPVSNSMPSDAPRGFEVLDISTPERPVRVGGYIPRGETWCAALNRGFFYLPGHLDFDVVDVSRPANPQRTAHAPGGVGSTTALVLSSNLAFTAETDWQVGVIGYKGGFRVYDVANPAHPKRIGGLDYSWKAADLALTTNYAYVADSERGLFVVDVSEPHAPAVVGSVTNLGAASSVVIAGSTAFFADPGVLHTITGAVQVVDISSPTNITAVARYPSPRPVFLEISGTEAYVADMEIGLTILDISQPALPRKVGGYHRDGGVLSFALAPGNRVFVCALGVGNPYNEPAWIILLDISDKANPKVLGRMSERKGSLRHKDGYVYCSHGWWGLSVVDFSDPGNPRLVGRNSSFHAINELAFHQSDRMLVAAGPDGLGVLEMYPAFNSITRTAEQVKVSWDRFGTTHLQHSTDIANEVWTDVPESEGTNSVYLPISKGADFFRLRESVTP